MGNKKIKYPSDSSPYGGFSKWFMHVTRMSFFVYYTRGLIALMKRIFNYAIENIKILNMVLFQPGGNVLFISGCPGGSRYYRCKNQGEFFSNHGLTYRIYNQHSMNLPLLVDKFDVFVFQRVIYDKYILKIMNLIGDKNKVIIYETDDLVYDPAFITFMDYYNRMGQVEKTWYENGIGREILEDERVKHCLVSTDYLAKEMKEKYPNKEIIVSYNKMGEEQIALAEKTLSKIDAIRVEDGKIRVGYFSGSSSHNKDFEEISDVLIEILRENKDVLLMVVGHLDLNDKFLKFENQIERVPFVPIEKLPELILKADINVAPLETNNPFCLAKSALKYFESGILGVPTIATATGDFTRCIRNGENGFIANNSEDWKKYLTLLIKSKDLREKIGKEAKKDSLQKHSTRNNNASEVQLVEFIKNISINR